MFATLVDIDVAIESAFFALHHDTSGIFNVLLYCGRKKTHLAGKLHSY